MKLYQLKAALSEHPGKNLRFVLPDGGHIPAEFHVTEVGHVTKNFIDCGGTTRSTAACVLQTWVSENDRAHRLTAGKLASILEMAGKVIPSDEVDVEVEYEGGAISQYPLVAVEGSGAELRFTLDYKHTDCLAREACGVEGGEASGCGCGSSEGACC